MPPVVESLDLAEPSKYPILWVKPGSNVHSFATLIASSIREDKRITLRAIGAGAVNQAIKSVIKASQTLAGEGENLVVKPGFATVRGKDGSEVTAIVLHCLLT
jgi:stage V sporulation protein S